MWWSEIHEANIFSWQSPIKKCSFLHEKGQCSYDSTRVKGVMKVCLVGVFHCCVDDDPPPGEKLHQSQARTCTSDVDRVKTESAASSNSNDERGKRRHKTKSRHFLLLQLLSICEENTNAWAIPGLRQPQMRWRSFSPPSPRCTRSLHTGSRPEILTWLREKVCQGETTGSLSNTTQFDDAARSCVYMRIEPHCHIDIPTLWLLHTALSKTKTISSSRLLTPRLRDYIIHR